MKSFAIDQWHSTLFVSRPIIASHYNLPNSIQNSNEANAVQLCT